LCLLMHEITRREIERHIAAKAKEAYESLEKFQRHGFLKNLRVPPFEAIAKGTTEEAIPTELMAHFNEFCPDECHAPPGEGPEPGCDSR
jgi:hypothetical protein